MSRSSLFGCLSMLALAACGSSSGGNTPANGSGSSSGGGSGSSSGTSGGGGNRATTTCDAVANTMITVGGGTAMAGSWGDIPTAMQMVPPGGTLCGSYFNPADAGGNSYGTAILTDLFGTDLYNFYKPLVTAAGCTLMTPDATSTMTFQCTNGGTGVIGADVSSQVVILTYVAP
jgi:hypothetical protein